MKSVPRLLPLVGVAIGGVLAVNALAGAQDLPGLVSGARAFAEEAAKGGEKAEANDAAAKDAAAKDGESAPAAASAALPAASIKPKPVCAPTAAELAKQAGLSPAELQVLQSLGQRRGQLDAREADLNTQLALMAAAEAKLDAKIKSLNGLKAEVKGLLQQTDAKEQGEIDRLVKVFEGMKAKDAAPRMVALDDSVRIPIAARMKERSLAAIVASMPPAEAKKLTEALARRFSDAKAAAERANAADDAAKPAASAEPVKQAAAPKAPAPKRTPPRKAAPAPQAKAAETPAAPVPYAPEATPAAPPATTG
ncbi:MAG: MotE family protein [Pseudomonadota bacterium]